MFRKLVSTVTILIFLVVSTAAGQLNIAYMNPQEVINQLPEKSEIERKLNDLIEQKRQQLQSRTANYQESVAQYQENEASMSQEQKQARQQELAKMEQDLTEFQRTIQNEIQQRRSQLLSPIFSRMDQVIASIAEERNLDFVLNESTGSGDNIIYYTSDSEMNITEEVLKRMRETTTNN